MSNLDEGILPQGSDVVPSPGTSAGEVASASTPGRSAPDPLEVAELLRHAERRAAMRRIAGALAHAVGTPLNVIAGRAALISQAPADKRSEHAANNAAVIERQVEGLVERIQQILKWVRTDDVKREICAPLGLLEAAAAVYAPLAENKGIAIRVSPAELAQTTLPRGAVLLVLVDLISLGISLVESGGLIDLEVRCEHAEPPPAERGRASAGKVARFRVHYVKTSVDGDLFASPYEPWNLPEHVDLNYAQLMCICFGVAREHAGWVEVDRTDSGTAIITSWPCS
jgi:two-component system, NtrC family, sensor kinase